MKSGPDSEVVATLFLLGGLIVAVALPAIHVLAGLSGAGTETADRGVFILFLALTAGGMIYAISPYSTTVSFRHEALSLGAGLSLLLILSAAASVVTVLPGHEDALWFGYGRLVAALSLALTPALVLLLRSAARWAHLGLATVAYGFIPIVYGLSLIQPPWGVIDLHHSKFVINEILAAASGSYPLVSFTSQYTSLLGYAFELVFQSRATVDNAVWFLTTLSVVTVVVALVPLVLLYPPHKKYLVILFTVPGILVVKANEGSYSGSVGALFSAIPIRLIFPCLAAWLLSSRLYRDSAIFGPLLLGSVCAGAVLNNLESGAVTALASILVMGALSNRPRSIRRLLGFGAAFLMALLLVFLILSALYGKVDLAKLNAFAGGFASGFGAMPMPTFGLWLFVFTFLSLSAVLATYCIWQTRESILQGEQTQRIAVLALFWALFGVGMAPYYINRSVVSGQLQFLLFPMFLSSAGLFLLLAQAIPGRSAIRTLVLIISALPCALSIASVIHFPSVDLAGRRLKAVDRLFSAKYENTVGDLRSALAELEKKHGDQRVGLFTEFGNIYSRFVMLPSYMPVSQQSDLEVVKFSHGAEICEALQKDKRRFLLSVFKLEPTTEQVLTRCGYRLQEEGAGVRGSGVQIFVKEGSP